MVEGGVGFLGRGSRLHGGGGVGGFRVVGLICVAIYFGLRVCGVGSGADDDNAFLIAGSSRLCC